MIKTQRRKTKEYAIYKAPREYVNYPCIWIHDGEERESGQVFKVEIELEGHNKNACYVQLREVDGTILGHKAIRKIDKINNVMLISEHYRNLLGIKKSDFRNGMKINATINRPRGSISKFIFMNKLSKNHPEVATHLSLRLGHIGFMIGLIGLGLGIISLILA